MPVASVISAPSRTRRSRHSAASASPTPNSAPKNIAATALSTMRGRAGVERLRRRNQHGHRALVELTLQPHGAGTLRGGLVRALRALDFAAQHFAFVVGAPQLQDPALLLFERRLHLRGALLGDLRGLIDRAARRPELRAPGAGAANSTSAAAAT